MPKPARTTLRTYFVRFLGWVAIPIWLVFVALVLLGPATWSSVLYLLGGGLVAFGLATAGSGRRRHLARWGLATIVGVALVRCGSARAGSSLEMAAPSEGSSRIVGRLVDEADVAVAGTRVLTMTGMLRDDAAVLTPAMQSAYVQMRAEEGDAPSPVVATYLGLQGPSGFDLIVLEPEQRQPPQGAMIFLHGFAGNFALPCWQMARAVARAGMVTACPSTSWRGDWWSPGGEAIVRRTVEILHARGFHRIVLAGLSNGGIGASRLAPRMRGTFAGLVLVSGVAADASPAGIPTLVVHGTHDTMTSFGVASAYSARSSSHLVALDAAHFAMLVRAEQHDAAVADFARRIVGGGARTSR